MAQIEDLGLDPGIVDFVRFLQEAGIETTESCQGGEGHAFPEPTVRFNGDNSEGFKALAATMQAQLPVQNCGGCGLCRMANLTAPSGNWCFTPKPRQNRGFQRGFKSNNATYRPRLLRSAHLLHSDLLPVPERKYRRSMLLPSVHFVLLWCRSLLTECHALVRDIFVPFLRGGPPAPHQISVIYGTLKFDGGALIQYN